MTQLITVKNRIRSAPPLPSRKRLYAMSYECALSALACLIDDLRDVDGAAGRYRDQKLEAAKVRYREMEIGHPGKCAALAEEV